MVGETSHFTLRVNVSLPSCERSYLSRMTKPCCQVAAKVAEAQGRVPCWGTQLIRRVDTQ